MFSIYNGIILIWCVFLPADLFELQVKKTHVLKVTNFMDNLKDIELLTFLYMFRSFRPASSQYQLEIIEAWHIS